MLSYKEKELIKDYMNREKTFNLQNLCTYLIENGSSKDAYSTGKLKLYPYVAVYAKQITTSSTLEIERKDTDITYHLKEELTAPDEELTLLEEEMKTKSEETKEVEKNGQLTLF
jgi:hypothetical protein